MTTLSRTILSLAILLIASLALAQGTYTQIDPPGAVSSGALGIDTAGDIVGGYGDAEGKENGFLLSGGTYTTIDDRFPNTSLISINDVGQIVGFSTVGFLYDIQTQKFTEIADPITHNATTPSSINNAGTIAGYYFYHGHYVGFELIGSTYTNIVPGPRDNTWVRGVSGSGKLVGNIGGGNFAYAQGAYKKLVIPGAPAAAVLGINPGGNALVGVYAPSVGVVAGFVYQNQTLTTLQFPGSTYTVANGINPAGEVVGYFYESNGFTPHGFTWTPPADAAKK